MTLADVNLSSQRYGSGDQILFLHGMDGLLFADPFLQALGKHGEVVAPECPGWGATRRQPHLRSMDDLAYPYLDLLDRIDGRVPLVGTSLGAWLAAEIATKSCAKISCLVLVAPVGLRSGEPTLRNYLDLYASPAEEVTAAMYGSADAVPDLSLLSDADFDYLAVAQEATSYYGWEPYMHNPALLARLHRITVPTLVVAGDSDGFVLNDQNVKLLVDALPDAREVTLAGVGHRIEEERPDELAELIADFVRQNS